jgi:hypothetical protein
VTARRVGFAVERPLRAWAARAAELAASAPGVEETVLFLLPQRARHGPGARSFDGYVRADRRLNRVQPDAFAEVEGAGGVEVAGPDEIAGLVAAHGLDVLVDLTDLALELPAGSPAELWTLRHGDIPAGAPHALFAEFAAGARTCATTLRRLVPRGDEVLYRSRSQVRRLSLQRTRNPVYWKSAAFVARALRDPVVRSLLPPGGAGGRAPTPAELAALQARLVRRGLAFVDEHLAHTPSWSIDWRAGESRTDGAGFVPSARLTPPRGWLYADPFAVSVDGRHYLLYEAYRRSQRRAEIAVRELVDGAAGPPATVLAGPRHLSYPFCFRAGDDLFLLPESAEDGVVRLYRAVDFPRRWRVEATLLEGIRAYDSTLVEHEGRWYLLTAVPESGADIDELHVFHADELRGPYRPHPHNPVVSDVTCARPAGRVFRRGDTLIRPAQDGSGGYGSAIALREIVRLSPEEYRERPAGRIEPSWDPRALGTHTIDHDGGIEVVDVKLSEPRWRSPL